MALTATLLGKPVPLFGDRVAECSEATPLEAVTLTPPWPVTSPRVAEPLVAETVTLSPAVTLLTVAEPLLAVAVKVFWLAAPPTTTEAPVTWITRVVSSLLKRVLSAPLTWARPAAVT